MNSHFSFEVCKNLGKAISCRSWRSILFCVVSNTQSLQFQGLLYAQSAKYALKLTSARLIKSWFLKPIHASPVFLVKNEWLSEKSSTWKSSEIVTIYAHTTSQIGRAQKDFRAGNWYLPGIGVPLVVDSNQPKYTTGAWLNPRNEYITKVRGVSLAHSMVYIIVGV